MYQVTNTQRKSWNIKKEKTKEKVNMLECPSSLKQMNFEMECFSSLQSCYKYRGDNLQQ